MNEYTAHGILDAATDGQTILVLSHNQHASREAFEDFPPLLTGRHGYNVRRTNGAEQIDCLSGGRILFRSINTRLRYPADVVYLDYGTDTELTTDHLNALLTTTGGRVVRC